MFYTVKDQERIIRKQFPTVMTRMAARLLAKEKEIQELAIYRCITLGVKEYGDASFHLDLKELSREWIEEMADATFYQSAYQAKVKGDIE